MGIRGITTVSLFWAVACPLLLVAGLVSRWLPWRTLVTKVRTPATRRAS
jgi:hypothetical protein